MRVRLPLSAALLAALAACGGPRPWSEPPWNVLVVTLDTTRADHLGCYGDESARTPNIDGLAAEGFLFLEHYSAVPVTTPSHSTIFTGTYPPFHGVRDNGLFRLPDSSRTLAEILQERGYATGAAIGAFPLTREYGLDQGFDFYEDHISISREDYRGDLTEQRRGLFFEERPATRVNDAILPWLRENLERPFFAWIHYWDPHHPHIPPEPFRQLYAHDLYQGEIAYADHSLGTVLGELERSGVLDRTLVVVTADHGEGRGEHEEDTHSLLAYNSTLRVPLVIRIPGLAGGERIATRAGTVDLLPTVLDLLGIEIGSEVQGRSLVPLIEGRGERRGLYYAETLSPRLSQGWGELRALYDGPHKLVYGPRPELFDLEADPGEVHNLWEERPELAESMRSGLEGYLSRLAGGPAADAVHDASEESLGRLAALGYLSVGGDSPAEIREQLRADGVPPQERVQDNSLSSQVKNLLTEGKYLAAKERAEHLLARDPGNAFYRSLLAMAYLGLDRPEAAARLIEEAASLATRNEAVFLEVTRRLFADGDRDRGLALLEKILAESESSMGLYLLAEMRAALGQEEAYQEAIEKAVELDPENHRARSSLAIHQAGRGRLEEAGAELLALVRERPLNPRFQHNYGALLLNAGKPSDAAAYLRRAIELAPGYWRAYLSLMSAELAAGLGEEAAATYDRLRERCRDPAVLEQARTLVEATE